MLAIGIASYENGTKLQEAVAHLLAHTNEEFKICIVDNNSRDPYVHHLLDGWQTDSRFVIQRRSDNIGYAGAVNQLLEWASGIDAPYLFYCDNDCDVQTPSWNVWFRKILEENHDVALVHPGGGFYEIQRPKYTEIQWGVGCFWAYKIARYREVGGMDTEIGHQQECDLSLRLRLAGWKIAAAKEVSITHHASATTNPAAQERINNGVIDFVNKWCKYFCGPQVNYWSPNVLRWEDFPINALYTEEWMQLQPELQGLNANPESVHIAALGRTVDLCRVPRWQHLYRGRII